MEPQDKKLALRVISYGLYVLTATDGNDYGAGGVNWLTQASFDPPLVVAAVKADSGTAFFRSTIVEGNMLNGHEFEASPQSANPLLRATPYWFEARVTDTVVRGDHTVIVAEVVGAGVRDADAVPLLLRSTGMNYGG